MKIFTLPGLGVLLITSISLAEEPKTANPDRIGMRLVDQEPYRYNGAVLTTDMRGSGFCAWSRKTFFSAAHVVYGATGWDAPPDYFPKIHSKELTGRFVGSRGYYRWADYAALADAENFDQPEFGRDVILAFSFSPLITDMPAKLNLNGFSDLRGNIKSMITGYPAENSYLEQSIDGFFMHRTGPTISPYQTFPGNALTTTLISTGTGNSGGPVWTKNARSEWVASGVLVGGLPSESVVYAFSAQTNDLLRAVKPVIQKRIGEPLALDSVSSSSTFFPSYYDEVIPDGVHEWTSFPISVNTFPLGAKVDKVKLSLKILTPHRGDLQVLLVGPGGFFAVIHNEGGATENDLIIRNLNVTEKFTGIDPNGIWELRVQDRLVRDLATIKSFVLEIATTESAVIPPP